MKKIALFLTLLVATPLSLSAMTVVGPQFPDIQELKKKYDQMEVRNETSEDAPLLTHEKKSGNCIAAVMCGGLFVIFVGLGLILPIVLCNTGQYCGSNSTLW